jgi:hypothetical protein
MLRRIHALRDERGQTASEYMGMLLLVAVVIGALIASGLPGQIADTASGMIDKISGGNETRTAGDNPGGGNNPGGGDDDGGGSSAATALATCISSGKAYGYCLKAFDPARYFVEDRPGKALSRVDEATKAILNSGLDPRDPDFQKLVDARNQAVNEYLATKPTANNKFLRALNNTKKLFDPRYKDYESIRDAIDAARGKTPTVPPLSPNPASGAPKTPTAASKVLKGLGKFGKGLGVVGAAIGGYSNIKNDGLGKGLTETATSLAAGYGAGSLAAAGCAALAVTGVGAVACGVGVLAVGIAGSEVGKRAGAWVYDNALAPAGEAIGDVATGAADKVSDGFDKAKDVGGKVVGALNPFG